MTNTCIAEWILWPVWSPCVFSTTAL